ncbi:MAG: XylR family transcriptional regulator, partial [Thermoguttaceae bacterium]
MGKSLRVALLVESSHAFGRQLLQGIAAYSETDGPWTFHQEERAFDAPMPPGLKRWRPDGVIARISTPLLARQLRRLGTPVVDLYEQGLLKSVVRVSANHREVMRLAVEHLRACAFQNFAYVGFPGAVFSHQRASWFVRFVTAWGFIPRVYDAPSGFAPRGLAALEAAGQRDTGRLTQWLQELPKPAGVVACNDMRAQQILAACGEHGINVPNAIAVIGVDNDDVRCQLSSPTLS